MGINQYGTQQRIDMERYDYRTQRLFVKNDLSGDLNVQPDRAQAGYLLNVLRLKEGAKVQLFNGRDGEWLSELIPTGRKSCTLHVLRQTRPQPESYDLLYLFAPLKQARLDYVIQKAVEMGAGQLQPVLTEHTQVTKLKLERIEANAIEAAEQCGILSLPVVRESIKLEKLLADWDPKRKIVFCDESADQESLHTSLEPLRNHSIAILIGPEGGFSENEREFLRKLPFVTAISLGPRILRADTAAVAALTIVQSQIGDWN